jgi:flagellar motor switch protein FliM
MHSEQAGADRPWSGMLSRQLQLAEVELTVPLAVSELTVEKVLSLKTGDVLPLTISDTVEAMVDGVPIMKCRYGIRSGQYALRIENFLAQEEAETG